MYFSLLTLAKRPQHTQFETKVNRTLDVLYPLLKDFEAQHAVRLCLAGVLLRDQGRSCWQNPVREPLPAQTGSSFTLSCLRAPAWAIASTKALHDYMRELHTLPTGAASEVGTGGNVL